VVEHDREMMQVQLNACASAWKGSAGSPSESAAPPVAPSPDAAEPSAPGCGSNREEDFPAKSEASPADDAGTAKRLQQVEKELQDAQFQQARLWAEVQSALNVIRTIQDDTEAMSHFSRTGRNGKVTTHALVMKSGLRLQALCWKEGIGGGQQKVNGHVGIGRGCESTLERTQLAMPVHVAVARPGGSGWLPSSLGALF
jgi:hypothetical protein